MGAVVGLCVGVAALLIVLALSSNRPARAPKESYVGALVKSAGLANVTARTVYTTMAIAGLATGSISLIITSLPIVALMAAVGTAFIPIFSVKRRARLRSKALRTSWPDAVDSLASSVRAGMSLPEAVADLSKNGPAQLRYAFAHFSDYYRSTGSFAQALNALQERLSDPIADRVISALRIAHEVGGTDLGHVLRTLSAFWSNSPPYRLERSVAANCVSRNGTTGSATAGASWCSRRSPSAWAMACCARAGSSPVPARWRLWAAPKLGRIR